MTKMGLAESLMLTNETLLSFCTSLMFITSLFKGSRKCRELQSLAEIIQEGETRGIIFIKSQFITVAKYATYISACTFLVVEAFSVMHFVIQDNYDLTTLKIFISDSILPLELSLSLHYVLLILLFQHMFNRVFLQIKFALTKLTENCPEILSVPEFALYSRNNPLLHQLKELRRMYTSIFLNYAYTQDFMSPSVLVWWITLIISLTITNFLVVRCNQELQNFGILYIFRALKGYVDFVMMVMYLTLMESTTKVVS